MNEQTWDYAQITAATEARVHEHIRFLKQHLQDVETTHKPVFRKQVHAWAYGAVDLWSSVTSGSQQRQADFERFHALLEVIMDQPLGSIE